MNSGHLCRNGWTMLCGVIVLTAGCGAERHSVTAPERANAPRQSLRIPALERAAPAPITLPSVVEPIPAALLAGSSSVAGREIYPLGSDNRWRYARHSRLVITPYSGPPETVFDVTWPVEMVQTCVESYAGREYRAEFWLDSLPQGPRRSWLLLRQDARGLYEADVALSTPPACEGGVSAVQSRSAGPLAQAEAAWNAYAARLTDPVMRAGMNAAWEQHRAKLVAILAARHSPPATDARGSDPTPPPGELLRLAYPLHVGQRWAIRVDPPFLSWVEGVESLALPAGRFVAYRIPISTDLAGPRDRVVQWYGRDGYLKFGSHIESVATDAQGHPIGLLVSDFEDVLIALDAPPRHAARTP